MAEVNFKRTGSKRLLKLADFLETEVNPLRFDMGDWGAGNEKGKPACGTSACALGWASAIPALNRAGAKLSGEDDPHYFKLGPPENVSAAVFGVDYDEHCDLFETDVYAKGRRGLKAAAKRIREFVKTKLAKSAA